MTTVRALLAHRIAQGDLCPGAATVDDWLALDWIRFRVRGRSVPVLPLWGMKHALVAHDLHHVLLDDPADLRGESELAVWELASGGCGWNVAFWIDRIALAAVAFVVAPRRMARAFARGRGRRNLYGSDVQSALDAEVDDVRARLRRR